MDLTMVNTGSFGSERNGETKASCMQANGLHTKTHSSSPLTASSATQSKSEFFETPDNKKPSKIQAVEPIPSPTDNSFILPNRSNNMEVVEERKSLFCSVPLEKVQTILSKYTTLASSGNKVNRKVMCLYCDRTFVNINLRQKHVERCHSSKQLRRVSLRKNQNLLTSTPCIYCDKVGSTDHTLKDLFKHLIEIHSDKYFGCLSCEERFLNSANLVQHNVLHHNFKTVDQELKESVSSSNTGTDVDQVREEVHLKMTRRKQKTKNENNVHDMNTKRGFTSERNLRSKKLSVKSSRMIIKRSKRLQAKINENKKKRTRTREFNEKKKNDRQETTYSTKFSEKQCKATSNHANPYPEFDHFFQVKKITDHSIDNLKISSLTFDDVFDKAFFNRIKSNIQENLLHHIDGKLFKNEESESRISNFEKISNIPQDIQNVNTENYGCELSINAIAPTTILLSNQLGDDPESQIEYGSKPSKKKTQVKKDEVHYKYFTRRKYQASILERKENRDLSKLDMWTQYIIKSRQQKILDDKKSPKEILDYFSGEEYKSIMRREELNRILDRRGPFEDLKEEVSKKAALEKLNGETVTSDDDNFAEIGEILNDILNKVFELAKEPCSLVETSATRKANNTDLREDIPEIPSYLNLRPRVGSASENEIDRSDKIALICSSQETENFELPSNTVRGKNEKVELTGEWARSRIYICAACGLKLQNIKQFLEHKSASHQHIWVQHYEFVGNQSELYRHLSIPVLGKVGVLENTVQCKIWKRSDARSCTKCGKQCNSLGELHRHILECGGDWTWMLARKKCKYRPFGAKSRRKRRGLVKRIYTQKTEPSEKKIYKKSFDLPRQKPSDADTIKRMLANLPPKRATRKIMCLKDGFNPTRNKQIKNTKQTKFKCGKLIRGKTKDQKVTKVEYEKTNKTQGTNHRRSLRCLNKVLTSRILETNTSLIVRRKYTRKIKDEERKRPSLRGNKSPIVVPSDESQTSVKKMKRTIACVEKQPEETSQTKRTSPRIEKRLAFKGAGEKMNIKHFFPVKKKNVEKRKDTLDENEPKKNLDSGEQSGKLNLRKRKLNSENNNVKKTTGVKTRRLRNSQKESPKPQAESETNNFFEEAVSKNSPEVPDEKNELEKKSEHCENSQTDSTLEKEVSIDTPVATSTVTQLKPEKPKRKLRKPARGLNDCIAMLTSKLSKNLTQDTNDTKTITSEYILKVPFFNEHFDLRASNKENECHDKDMQSLIDDLNPIIPTQEDKGEEKNDLADTNLSKEESEYLGQISEDVLLTEPNFFDAPKDVDSDSEDEVPLSSLCSRSVSATIFDDIEKVADDSVEVAKHEEAPKKSDATVLMEINENFCDQSESATSENVDTKNSRSEMTENNVAINIFGSSTNDTKETDKLLDDICSDKLNYFINNVDDRRVNKTDFIKSDETLNGDENLVADDFSESKENSVSLVDESAVKQKPKKNKIVIKNNGVEINWKTKEQKVGKRKTRSAKAKALESILDDALLELSENEIFNTQKNLLSDNKEPIEDSGKNCSDDLDISVFETNAQQDSCLMGQETQSELFDSCNDETCKSKDEKTDIDNAKELRRSRRNSKKITCYNEVDLVDPLLDDLDSDKTISKILRETTKDIFGMKRKNRKTLTTKKIVKNGQNDKEYTGDELFDLLKATPNENNVFSKPADSFFNSFDEISNDFNENFDVLEDILEKSIAVIEENLSEQAASSLDSDSKAQNKKVTKKKSKRNKHRNRKQSDLVVAEHQILLPYVEPENGSTLESLDNDVTQSSSIKSNTKVIFCDICNKSFSRMESLNKHKRTLTHISKLSELEAKEAALKKCDLVDKEVEDFADSGKDINLLGILENVEVTDSKQIPLPFSVNVDNSNLKLADIINDVLNKPIAVQKESEVQPEIRRYKSLAERKSFESENCFEPPINNAAAGTILEKQITLLENIIENRASLNYIDELSVSSSDSMNGNNVPLNEKTDIVKSNLEESFLKPTQYEEISEDSNLRNHDEQKSRKVLNRDEELFLECCSLLKSGSEVSNYSKKSNVLKSLDVKSDWLEQKETGDFVECYSDSSRMRTPLGDGFSQDDSISATSWIRNNSVTDSKKMGWKKELGKERKLSFGEVFSKKDADTVVDELDEESGRLNSSFHGVLSEDVQKRNTVEPDTPPKPCDTELKDTFLADGKKMLTKGAMKVFEGLKVSIPTEELSIDKILTSGQALNVEKSDKPTKSIKRSSSSQKSVSRMKTKHSSRASNLKEENNMQINSKTHDVYDFEETQDNSDVFTKPDFKSFRNNYEKVKKTDKAEKSDDDSQDCTDAVSCDSTSSLSEQLPTIPKTQQNITKKKCMIMGRIFKNAVKSRDIDEDIRSIPVMDNTKLVEDFVLSCPEPIVNPVEKKTKMTEEELNLAFDNLVNNKCGESKQILTKSSTSDKIQNKNGMTRRKVKTKTKKRSHGCSDSSDDEFKLQKSSKKRPKKKSDNTEDSCINLEQELKECIGVASRKSQRKCTSGKQNVLIEYWSSDESSFETMLERQLIESVQINNAISEALTKENSQRVEVKEVIPDESTNKQTETQLPQKKNKIQPANYNVNRRKRAAANPLYHWSSSSEDESRDLIEIRPIRDEVEDDDDRPVQHGWIVGDSPKKLVTMLAQAKGKKCEVVSVKEHGKRRTSTFS